MENNELYHHGILGMSWGVRNGPPYPLSSSAHSSEEKKAGWRKSLSKKEKQKKKKKIAKGVVAIASLVATNKALKKIDTKKFKKEAFEKTIKQGKDKEKISPAGKITKETSNIANSSANIAKKVEKVKRANEPDEAKQLSTEELKKRINRLRLEQQYRDLKSQDVSDGKLATSEILETIGDVTKIAGSAVAIYEIMKLFKKG